jgi:hypothetical protein
MTEMKSTELSESARQELEAGREAKAQSLAEFAARTKGKPTPTQEENDEAALGKHFVEHEPDGGDPDPQGQANPQLGKAGHTKQLEGKPGGDYQTRQAQAAKPATPQQPPSKPAS